MRCVSGAAPPPPPAARPHVLLRTAHASAAPPLGLDMGIVDTSAASTLSGAMEGTQDGGGGGDGEAARAFHHGRPARGPSKWATFPKPAPLSPRVATSPGGGGAGRGGLGALASASSSPKPRGPASVAPPLVAVRGDGYPGAPGNGGGGGAMTGAASLFEQESALAELEAAMKRKYERLAAKVRLTKARGGGGGW
jgi:hypothetical protein